MFEKEPIKTPETKLTISIKLDIEDDKYLLDDIQAEINRILARKYFKGTVEYLILKTNKNKS